MTTALEHALQMEQEKFAAENGGQQNMTPMQQGYMDAMAKLGYEIKGAEGPVPVAPATSAGKGYAAALKGRGKGKAPVAPPLKGRGDMNPGLAGRQTSPAIPVRR